MRERDLYDIIIGLNMGLHPLNKLIVTQKYLPLQVRPWRIFINAFSDELRIALLRQAAAFAKLRQQTIHFQPKGSGFQTYTCPVTAPCPVARLFYHTSAYRIKYNIRSEFQQIGIAVDKNSFEASLKQVTNAPVATIAGLRADTVELALAFVGTKFEQLLSDHSCFYVEIRDNVLLAIRPGRELETPEAIELLLTFAGLVGGKSKPA